MESFRFGIMGAGGIAHKFCDAARRVGCEVAAVASKSLERAKEFAGEENIPAAFGSYEEMLKTTELDGIYVATTHNFHYENVMLALEHGLPVLCEKCMVRTRREAEEIFAEGKKRNLFVMEAMWSRFLPQIQKARQWVAEGRIRKVELATSIVAFRAEYDPKSRIFDPALAGGAMYDIGVYAIEVLTYLLGEPVLEVKSMTSWAESGADKADSLLLRFENCLANVQTGVMVVAPEGITLSGREGYIFIPYANVGNEAFLYNRERQLVEHFKEEYPNGFTYEIEETVRCVRAGLLESPVVPHEETLRCAGIFDQVLSR